MSLPNENQIGTGDTPTSQETENSVGTDFFAIFNDAYKAEHGEIPEDEGLSEDDELDGDENTQESDEETQETETEADASNEGDDETQESEPEALGDDEFVFETENGKKFTLPKELESYTLRQRDYTKKTQALKAEQTEFYDKAKAEIDHLLAIGERYDSIGHAIKTQFGGDRNAYLQMIAREHPAYLNDVIIEINQRDAINQELKQKQADIAAQEDAVFKAEQAEILASMIPEWNDESVRKSELGTIAEYLKDKGCPETDFPMIQSAWMFNVLRDAQRYNAGKAVDKKITGPAPTKKTVVKGVSRPAQSTRNKLAQDKKEYASASSSDRAAILLRHINKN